MKHFVVPMELKEVSDKGLFSGYASVFGNVDLGGDVIAKDMPFKEIVTNAEGKVKTLFQHDSGGGWGSSGAGGLPIGLASVEQNTRGLKFEGELVMDDPFVKRVHTHLKAGTLDGMSIGFDIMPGGAKVLESGVRELTALKLWEISVVTFGMNPKAKVEAVKNAGQITTIREFEAFLRDAGKFTNAQAKLLASGGWKTLQDAREESGLEGDAQRLIEFLNNVSVR